MKALGGFLGALILFLLLRDATQQNTEASTIATKPAIQSITPTQSKSSVPILEDCTSKFGGSDYLGVYISTRDARTGEKVAGIEEIRICSPRINAIAKSYGFSEGAVRRYVLAHESAHAAGERTEQGADKAAIDQLAAVGDWEAIEAYSQFNKDGSGYDWGKGYAKFKLSNKD